MKELIAYCGLDCEKCDARVATVNNDDVLREKTAELWSEMNQVPITKEISKCKGCRVDGGNTPFCDRLGESRKCAGKKGLDTCGDCAELEHCQTVKMVIENSPDALKNLKEMK